MISNGQILAMAVSAALCLLVPLVGLIVWKRRTHATLWAALLGVAVFVVFVLGLEQQLHALVLGDGSIVLQKPWLYVLYASLAAGIFEETGRYLTFRYVLRKYDGRETGVMYGIGHGGVEAILLCGINMVAYIILALNFNSSGGVSASGAMYHPGISLYYTPVWAYLLPCVERMAALALQIALSVVVFQAAKRPGKRHWYFYAVLIHTGVDAVAALYQVGAITSLALTELAIVGLTLVICWRVTLLYLRDWTEPEPEEEALCAGPEDGEGLPDADGETAEPEQAPEEAPADAEAPEEAAEPSAEPEEPEVEA